MKGNALLLLVAVSALVACFHLAAAKVNLRNEAFRATKYEAGKKPTPEFLADSKRWAAYAFAAYCPREDLQAWKCFHCQNNGLADAGDAAAFEANITDTQVYVAVNKAKKEIVVSFRGTKGTSIKNILSDANLLAHRFDVIPGKHNMNVHKGIYTTWLKTRDATKIMDELKSRIAKYPGFSLIFTGHSLGGALATLAASHVKAVDKIHPRVISFGSPRVGNKEFANWFNSQFKGRGQSLRYVHGFDVVTHVPPAFPPGYVHVAQEIWNAPGDEDLQFCSATDGEDKACSWDSKKRNVADHMTYIGIPLKCRPEEIVDDAGEFSDTDPKQNMVA